MNRFSIKSGKKYNNVLEEDNRINEETKQKIDEIYDTYSTYEEREKHSEEVVSLAKSKMKNKKVIFDLDNYFEKFKNNYAENKINRIAILQARKMKEEYENDVQIKEDNRVYGELIAKLNDKVDPNILSQIRRDANKKIKDNYLKSNIINKVNELIDKFIIDDLMFEFNWSEQKSKEVISKSENGIFKELWLNLYEDERCAYSNSLFKGAISEKLKSMGISWDSVTNTNSIHYTTYRFLYLEEVQKIANRDIKDEQLKKLIINKALNMKDLHVPAHSDYKNQLKIVGKRMIERYADDDRDKFIARLKRRGITDESVIDYVLTEYDTFQEMVATDIVFLEGYVEKIENEFKNKINSYGDFYNNYGEYTIQLALELGSYSINQDELSRLMKKFDDEMLDYVNNKFKNNQLSEILDETKDNNIDVDEDKKKIGNKI